MTERPPTLMEEVEEALAQSLLVFMVADLRLMSATGRVETKYETIAVASDPPTRSTAAELAGLLDAGSIFKEDSDREWEPQKDMTKSMLEKQQEGLSPAQIMAVLMIELHRSVKAKKMKDEANENEVADDSFLGWNFTGKRKSRTDGDDMHSLLRAYAEIIGHDIKKQAPQVEKRKSLLNLTPPKPSVRQTSLDSVEEEDVEQGGDEQDALGDAVDQMGRIAEETKKRANKQAGRVKRMRQSVMRSSGTKANDQFKEVTDAVFKMGASSRDVLASLRESTDESEKSYFAEDELVNFMERAVESRIPGKLDFLADYFEDGSVSKLMAQSQGRLVWINDWYPLKDLTYSIAVDKKRRRVLVVFRGAITKQDWSKAVESRNFRRVPNPIDEDYEGKTATINVSMGFYEYLGRVRKDTGSVKYDEIANLAHKYGTERIGDDFHLVVNGHSLGGALSTTFSFFASTDERFTKNGPVKCFNFGAPYVGGKDFMKAFHHQERSQKLIYARLFNHNDVVAHLPPNMRVTKDGGKFRHVGIGVRLPSVPLGVLARVLKWRPDVFYIKEEGFARSYWRAIRDNFILKFPYLFWRFARMHKLEELQRRLMYGKEIGGGEQFDLLMKPVEELYDKMVGTSYGVTAAEAES